MSDTRVIDMHAHVLHPDVQALTINHCVATGYGARPRPARPQPGDAPFANFERMTIPAVQIADMDARGIDHALISTSTVSQSTFWADAGLAAELDRTANEGIADWVRAHPARFSGAFTLPLQDLGRALAELEHCVRKLGMRAVNLPAEIGGRYLGDPSLRPLWEAIDDLGVVAFLHPDGIKDPAFQQYSLWNGIGQGIEETRLMASLIYEGVLERHPGLVLVMAHAGGYLPFTIARLDRNATAHPPSMANITRKPSTFLRAFHYDTVTYDPVLVDFLAARVGADRIVFGTDYPFGERDPRGLVEATELTEAERAAVMGGNARRVLGLDTPGP